jgi:hypothetical protein
MQVEVSNGELYDKHTILEIKKDKGLPVDKELKKLSPLVKKLKEDHESTEHLYQVLLSINTVLWDIEDTKRQCERDKEFGKKFVEHSRLVYLLNDQRASVKRMIDDLTNSNIIEYKEHKGR